MRYSVGLLWVLALSLVFVACGAERDGCAEPTVDAIGDWYISSTVVTDGCDGREDVTFVMSIAQDGNAVTGETEDFGTFSGTVCGERIQVNGRFPDDGGTVTADVTLTVSDDGDSMQGSDTWTWTDGFESCSGSDSLVGTRIVQDPACSPWCAVIDECTGTGVSECMDACAVRLLQAQATSSECADALRSQILCVAELACTEFYAWADEDPPDAYPCKSANDNVSSVCL